MEMKGTYLLTQVRGVLDCPRSGLYCQAWMREFDVARGDASLKIIVEP
jgi:hypothetical protein